MIRLVIYLTALSGLLHAATAWKTCSVKVCETDVDVTTFDRKIIHIKKEGDYLDMKAVIHPKLWAMVWNRADTFTSKLSITNTPGRVSATIAHDLCSGVTYWFGDKPGNEYCPGMESSDYSQCSTIKMSSVQAKLRVCALDDSCARLDVIVADDEDLSENTGLCGNANGDTGDDTVDQSSNVGRLHPAVEDHSSHSR